MRSKFLALGVVPVLALVLAACGGTEETTTTTATAGATTSLVETATTAEPPMTMTEATESTVGTAGPATGESLTITATDELRFKPDAIEMNPGQQVQLTFQNAGSVQHSLVVLKADSELEHVLGETDEEHMHEELHFDMHEQDGGESMTEAFTAPAEPGTYVFACLVPGHAGAGMVGTLTVQ